MEAPQTQTNGNGPVIVPPPPECSVTHHHQGATWSSTADIQRARNGQELQKLKPCLGAQCGVGLYEGISVPVVTNGHLSSQASRLYPTIYMQQQQPHPMAVRTVHHHHYHLPGSVPNCAPHPGQSYGPVPQSDRMVQGSSAASVTPAHQIRSVFMNHPSPSYIYSHSHHPSPVSGSNYFPQTTTANSGISTNGPCMNYNYPHGHSGQGVPVSAPSATTSHYSQQQQRSIPTPMNFRVVQNPMVSHPQKIINPSQTALYQYAYQHYTQNIQQQQHGMMQSQNHLNGSVAPNQNRAVGTGPAGVTIQQPITSQSRVLQLLNRATPSAPQQSQQNPVYPPICQTTSVPSCSTPRPHLSSQSSEEETLSSGPKPKVKVKSLEVKKTASNENMALAGIPSKPGINIKDKIKSISVHTSSSNLNHRPSVIKTMSAKLKYASPEKLVKVKASKSATKVRERQPKFIVGRKKMSTGNISISGGKKLKSTFKAASNSSTGTVCERSVLVPKSGGKNRVHKCAHVEPLCPATPPPGFEHLTRPAFPIEMCDPSLLTTLMSCQLHFKNLVDTNTEQSYAEEDNLLSCLPCCYSREIDSDEDCSCECGKSPTSRPKSEIKKKGVKEGKRNTKKEKRNSDDDEKTKQEDTDAECEEEQTDYEDIEMDKEEEEDNADLFLDEWEILNSSIRSSMKEWTDELYSRSNYLFTYHEDFNTMFKNF